MKNVSMAERFWMKVDKNGPVVTLVLGACWIWTGSTSGRNYKNGNGYGIFWDGKKLRKATHVAWELKYAVKFPKGKHACHHCDNPRCVRGSHIYVGDNFTNQQDRIRRGRHNFASLTHCKNGHPLTEENVYHYGKRRRCRICLRLRHTKHYAKMRAQGYWKSGQSKGWRLIKDKQ
jgi:hypothetical protein